MKYLGDYTEDYATLNFKFSTHKSDGTPIALSGSPAVSVYKANNTTQSTAGVTLSTDFDSVTGLNNVLIDLSADAFYAVGNDYQVVITAGTVNGISVVGTVLAHFSIENRFQETDVVKISGSAVSTSSAQIGVNVVDKTGFSLSAAGVQAIWEYTSRTLTSFGALVSDIVSAVWGASTRTLSAFGFSVTVGTNSDKSGYALSVTPPTAAQIRSEIDSNSTQLAAVISNIASLNNVSVSQVLAQVASALNTYDPPTKQELDTWGITLANKVDATASGSGGGGDATLAKEEEILTAISSMRTHGDSAWITGGGMSGSNAVTINVHDESGVNVVEASVEIWDSTGGTFYEKKFSNSSGQAVFNMNNGTYTVKIHKAGYSFTNQTLVVPATTPPVYTGTAYSVTPAADPDVCKIYTFLRTGDGGIPASAVAELTIVKLPYLVDNAFYASTVAGTYNAQTGELYWEVVRGATVNIAVPAYNIKSTFVIPDMAIEEIENLIS